MVPEAADCTEQKSPAEYPVCPYEDASGIEQFASRVWPIAFAVNMIVPVILAMMMTSFRGWIGTGVAGFTLLILGYYVCRVYPRFGVNLIFGAGIVAATQFYPILQFLAGTLAIELATKLGLVVQSDDWIGLLLIATEVSGFVVTFACGTILLVTASIVGLLIGFLLSVFLSRNETFAPDSSKPPTNGPPRLTSYRCCDNDDSNCPVA